MIRYSIIVVLWQLSCLLLAGEKGTTEAMHGAFVRYVELVHARNEANTLAGKAQLNTYMLEQQATFTFDKSGGSWVWQHGEGKFMPTSSQSAAINAKLKAFNDSANKQGITIYLLLGNYISLGLPVYKLNGYQGASSISDLKNLYEDKGEKTAENDSIYGKALQTFHDSWRAFFKEKRDSLNILYNKKGILVLSVHRYCNLEVENQKKIDFKARTIKTQTINKKLIVGYKNLYSHVAASKGLELFDIQNKTELLKPNFSQGNTYQNISTWVDRVINLLNFEDKEMISRTLTAIKKNVQKEDYTYNTADSYIMKEANQSTISSRQTLDIYGEKVLMIMNILELEDRREQNVSAIAETDLKTRETKNFVSKIGQFKLSGDCVVFTLPYKNRKGNAIELAVPKGKAEMVKQWIYADPIFNALKEMEEYLGNGYEQEFTGYLRTSLDDKATENMDCSEFTSRFIQKALNLDRVPWITSSTLSKYNKERDNEKEEGQLLEYVIGSNSKSFKAIEPGYIFFWEGGHMGVVISYDINTDIVKVIEALDQQGSRDEALTKESDNYCKNCVRISYYHRTGEALFGHTDWKGYFKIIKQ